jgi:hypothetical protein
LRYDIGQCVWHWNEAQLEMKYWETTPKGLMGLKSKIDIEERSMGDHVDNVTQDNERDINGVSQRWNIQTSQAVQSGWH